MPKLLWLTADRHPKSLQDLIEHMLRATGWEIFQVSYDALEAMEGVPLKDIDAVLLAPARFLPPRFMDRLENCRLMQIWSSGYDKFNIGDAHSRGIPVANNHGSNAISVAEHTMLMMLGVSRRAPEMHNRVVTGNWAGNDHGMTSHSLTGKTLGIVGLGKIGTLVAERATSFGMDIIFTDPAVREPASAKWKKTALTDLFARADYITFHVHLGPETRNLLNSRNINLLKKGPFIINVSRAELIERETLVHALKSGAVRGVAIDAHYEEPTSPRDELFSYGNVFYSPHVAGSTIDSYQDTVTACIENIRVALNDGNVAGLIMLQT